MSDIPIEFEKQHIRAIIAYCFKRGLSATEAVNEINSTFKKEMVFKSTVERWFRQFKMGRITLSDEKHPGRPVEVTTDANVSAIRDLIEKNPRTTVSQMAAILKISEERVYNIIRNILGARYLCVQWVPHDLTQTQRDTRLKMCRNNLATFEFEGPNLYNKLVTGDETWIYYYDNPSTKEAKLWVLEDEAPPKIAKKDPHIKKLMYAVFFRSTGLVKVIRLKKGEKVTADWYTNICLPQVFEALEESRPKSGTKGFFLHHDNARPHKAKLTQAFLDDNKIKLLPHPPYSPDLAPCDFWLFRKLKKHLRGKSFSTEEEIDIEVNNFFESKSPEDWYGVYLKWQERMKRCIKARGDYI